MLRVPLQSARVTTALSVRRIARRVLSLALFTSVGNSLALSSLSAQTTGTVGAWRYSGDVGATIGGDWLRGDGAPTVSGTTGAQLALGVQRNTTARARVGTAIRISSQPLRLSERGTHWDGGTIAVTQLLGTVGLPLSGRASNRSAVELGGGFAFLSGARSIAPFSTAGRLAPSADAALVLGRNASSTDARSGFDFRALSLVIRYDVTRLDPNAKATAEALAQNAVSGWVGRVVIGMRVDR